MVPERSGSGVAFDRAGRVAAYVVETFATPPHIEYGTLGATRAITHDNDGLPSRAVAESVSWKSEGHDVQGWLLAPSGVTGSTPRPMITDVHGGPSSAFTPRYVFGDTDTALLAKGYYVFKPNPRGSYGQGLAFANRNYRDFGGGDLRDILAGVTRVTRSAPVDPQRLGIMGHSYGGFMTMWAVTHTKRFKAAVAGAGVANWVSYYGQNGIDAWMPPFFGATLYDDPRIYDRLSPIRTIKAARTPTFLYVGERDIECPPAQSEEFWHALRALGVPTSLVIYEGEGHGIRKRENRDDIIRRELAWFERYLGADGARR
jgi:dipeptidyl aminopeptidase/acylaminoacyl peptidase